MSAPISLDDRFTIGTRHWHDLEDGRVQCDVCPRTCRLHEGQRGPVFRPSPGGRPDRAHLLRAIKRVLRRSGGEEAAQPFPARARRCCPSAPPDAISPASSARTGTSPSPERSTHSPMPRPRRPSPQAAEASWAARSVAFTYNDPTIFLEYAIDVADACHERGIRASRSLPATSARRRGSISTPTWTPLTSTSRRSPRTSTTGVCAARPGAGTRHAGVPAPRDRRMARDHHTADPRPQRLRRRNRRRDPVDRRTPRCGRAAALHRIPSRLQDARPPADAARDAVPRPPDRTGQRLALRLHRQRARFRRRHHLLPGLRRRRWSCGTGTS